MHTFSRSGHGRDVEDWFGPNCPISIAALPTDCQDTDIMLFRLLWIMIRVQFGAAPLHFPRYADVQMLPMGPEFRAVRRSFQLGTHQVGRLQSIRAVQQMDFLINEDSIEISSESRNALIPLPCDMIIFICNENLPSTSGIAKSKITSFLLILSNGGDMS